MHAELFDLDGVLVDTEPQYTAFWGQIGKELLPDVPHFEQLIKGQTLKEIYDRWLPDAAVQARVTERLDAFEARMDYPLVPGAMDYLRLLRQRHVPTAIATSSNRAKMGQLFRRHPDLTALVSLVLTAEDFTASKPDPFCYLLAARRLGADIRQSVVYEDSHNGLLAARRSGARVVALTTTLSEADVAPLADRVVPDFLPLL